MGIQLPGELASLLQTLGFNAPGSDPFALFHKGNLWLHHGDATAQPLGTANDHAIRAFTENKSPSIEQARTAWQASDSPHTHLLNGTTGSKIIGLGLMICGAIVLGLLAYLIIQLIQLLILIIQALASGVGAAWIPVQMKITSMLVNLGFNTAMNAVLGG